jgi:serine/threonine protein kinase
MTETAARLATSLGTRYTHDRRVAVKVLHPDLAATLGAERFLAEIKTAANLQHPHILRCATRASPTGSSST